MEKDPTEVCISMIWLRRRTLIITCFVILFSSTNRPWSPAFSTTDPGLTQSLETSSLHLAGTWRGNFVAPEAPPRQRGKDTSDGSPPASRGGDRKLSKSEADRMFLGSLKFSPSV